MITGLSQYSDNPIAGNVTVYSYNENGFLEKTTDPMGNTEYNELFDIYGNILAKTDKIIKHYFIHTEHMVLHQKIQGKMLKKKLLIIAWDSK